MTSRVALRFAAGFLVVLCGAVPEAAAQPNLSAVLDFLVTGQSVQTGSVERDRAAAEATRDTLARALLANLATLPVATSSGAFVYRLNPQLGTVERTTQSFGPLFVERAVFGGLGAGTIGVTFQHFRFNSLDGYNLRDGSLVTLANRFVDEPAPFDVDRLTLNIDADVATVHAAFGVHDRAEIGIAVPMIRLQLTGSRANVYRDRTFTQAAASATALGFADAILRGKITVVRGTPALALAADLRLPTGRQEDLLGAGSRTLKLSTITSVEHGPVSAHGTAGWTSGGLTRDLNYAGAVAFSSDRLTWTAELIGRASDTLGRITTVAAPRPGLSGVETIRLQPEPAGLQHMVTLAPGIKWNVAATWLITASFSMPLTRHGLVSFFAPMGGFDYDGQW
jgi:hypothetical protein